MKKLLTCFILLWFCQGAMAGPISRSDVPESLRGWIPWVLSENPTAGCPLLQGTEGAECAWAGRLELQVDAKGGRFTQTWQLYRAGPVPLPGGAAYWPQEVMIDRKAVAVVSKDQAPVVYLPAGTHTVSGQFSWNQMPESLPVAARVGVVGLTLNGKAVAFPRFTDEGHLWLQAQDSAQGGADTLELRVNRLITDSIPLTVTTRLQLSVSGKNREILVAPPLLQGQIAQSLDSPLPARLDPSGALRVQVRPGEWSLTLVSRQVGPVKQLQAPPAPATGNDDKKPDAKGIWASEEVWAFVDQPALRIVKVEGLSPVDARQTTLPADWHRYPAFRLQPGDTMKLVETKRGDPEPAPDQLTLRRVLWLDFAGTGYTVQDQISGSLSRSWRLELPRPAILGRVAVDGQDQFITVARGGQDPGVEVRRGQANIVADSRIEGSQPLAVGGWKTDFTKVSAELNMPPGWRLLTVLGADQARGTWLGYWTQLMNLFLLLIAGVAIARLWGWRWGAVGLVGLALLFPENDAPRWSWLAVLVAVALLRALRSPGWPRRVVLIYRALAMLTLVALALPFMVHQIRTALYPSLEHSYMSLGEGTAVYQQTAPAKPAGGVLEELSNVASPPPPPAAAPAPAPDAPAESDRVAQEQTVREEKAKARSVEPRRKAVSKLESVSKMPASNAPNAANRAFTQEMRDPNVVVQTGPGLPNWAWNKHQLSWSGPVDSGQSLQIVALSPLMASLVTVLRLLLLVLLVVRLLDVPLRRPGWPGGPALAAAVMLGMATLLTPPPASAQSGFPSPEIINDLKEKLGQKPDCAPDCASLQKLRVEVTGRNLRLRLEVHASEAAAVALPGGTKQWLPQRVLLNGKEANTLARRDSQLWLAVPAGTHQVLMEGDINGDAVALPLPLKPMRVESSLDGWTLDGVTDEGTAENALQLNRVARSKADSNTPSETLPPFLRIERTLRIGLVWQVDTVVTRVSPAGSPVVLEIPLLPGESVTSAELRVDKGKLQFNLSPTATSANWTSTLTPSAELKLIAGPQTAWTEVWRLEAAPMWHADVSGIAVVAHQQDGRWAPQWQPWPGETVTIKLSKPQGVAGQSLTIDSSRVTVTPGERSTDVLLNLRLRSSRGGQFELPLPEGAVLQQVKIAETEQPLRPEGRLLRIPLAPGAQEVSVYWRQPGGAGAYFTTPELKLGQALINSQVRVKIPQDRWVVALGGPRLGPAVLFWGVLLVLLVVSFGLARIPHVPLKTWQWFLLGLGLSQAELGTGLIVIVWFALIGWRGQAWQSWGKNRFNLLQLLLVPLTLLMLLALLEAVRHGLVGAPDLSIEGNGSNARELIWFQDRTNDTLPQAWVLMLPLLAYRLLLLVWALWLASSLVGWLRWGWQSFSAGGTWRRVQVTKAGSQSEAEV